MYSTKTNQKKARKGRSSLRTSLFFQAFFLLLVCAIGTAFLAYILARRELTVRSMVRLQSTVSAKGLFFEDQIAREKEQLSILGRETNPSDFTSLTKNLGFTSIGLVSKGSGTTLLAGDKASYEKIPDTTFQKMSESPATVFLPLMNAKGWNQYIIAAPHFIDGVQEGMLVALFDAGPLTSAILQSDNEYTTTEILLVKRHEYETIVLHAEKSTGDAVRIYEKESARTIPLIETSLAGTEGMIETKDYAGILVLAAYRSLPSLGWSVVAKIDTYEVSAPIMRLALNLVGVSVILVSLLSLSMFILARRIVGPLEELSKKLHGLEVKRWNFVRSIFTGNELEDVDEAATDLTIRLQKAHERLEEIVAEKSASLRKELAENKTILESIDYGLIVTDQTGCISYMNDLGAKLSGWDKQEVSGKLATDFLIITDKDGKVLEGSSHPIGAVLSTHDRFNSPIENEFSLRHKNGELMPIHIRATPILIGETCLGVVAIFRDITEERHIDHMKSEFISLVSHQLRTPLSSMRWYLEMLLSLDAGPLTPDQKDYVEEVATSNSRMVHLVNALLNVSRMELGKMQLSPESIEPKKLIETILKTFDLDMRRKKITLKSHYDIANGLVVRSDRGLMQLIIENLISNAIKYANENSEIRIAITPDSEKKNFIITVQSTGLEIPEQQKQYIGKKLFRATNARLSNTDGNGLGLYISNVAADAIGATLTFESVKESTTFTLSIPLQ